MVLSGNCPIGVAYLWYEDADEREICDLLPGVPLLTHVEILPKYRSHGIGTKLIAAAERELVARDHTKAALAVEQDNVRAIALYKRLGYYDWGHPHVRCLGFDDGSGAPLPVETCVVMVKDLWPATD